jgi:Leucine-rich repeat (LRR) protein
MIPWTPVIMEEGPSYRLELEDEGITLVVTDKWTNNISQLLADGRADGLSLNYAKGFKDTDLATLQDWPLRRLRLLARTAKDLEPISRLAGTLESLSVQTAPNAMLDLAAFPRLSHLGAGWGQIRSSISEAPQLCDLFILSYDEADLTSLRWNSSLKRLRFKDRPRIRSLNGVELLRSLDHLGVYLAPLEDIESLGYGAPLLRELHLEACRVRDLSPLASQRNLTFLNVSDCGEIDSLAPLKDLSQLTDLWLYGTTKILNNDLSPLLDLPHLRQLKMQSRRSYQPSVDIVKALCSSR